MKPLEVDDASPCFQCGSVECAFCSKDVELAVRGLVDEICTAWSIEHQDECAEMLEYMEKWFPSLFSKENRKGNGQG